MSRFDCVLIGGQSLLIRCAEALLSRGHRVRAVVSASPDIVSWAAAQDIVVLAPGDDLAERLPDRFDWLFSIANLSVIRDEVLARPEKGAINFHDGPLPHYAGLNAPVWAILGGETRHGVAWHMMEGGLDQGDVVATSPIEIAPDETAFTLNAKCYAAALDSFRALIAHIEAGGPVRQRQDLSRRTYYGRHRRPAAGGFLDFSQPVTRLSALVRALDHGTYWNPLCCAKIAGEVPALVTSAEPAQGHGAPGEVLSVGADTLVVAAADGAVRLGGLREPHGAPLSAARVARVGLRLAVPAPDLEGAAPGEAGWRHMLAQARPVSLALVGRGEGGGQRVRPLSLPGNFDAEALWPVVAAVAVRSAGAGDGAVAVSAGDSPAPDWLCDWGPVQFGGPSFGAAAADFARSLDRVRRHPFFASDLFARDPALDRPAMPDIGIGLDGRAIPGCAVTVVATDGGARLMAEAGRVSDAALELIAGRIETLALAVSAGEADGVAMADLPMLGAREERRLLRDWNATDRDHPRDTMHRAVAARAAQAPDETALIHETRTMSRAELEARANRIAHALAGMGVRRGQVVALHCRRGFDLVAAALGILKAGGAYLPLDPTYPADRLAHYLSDSGAGVIVTQVDLAGDLPPCSAAVLAVDVDPRVQQAPADAVVGGAGPADLAYMIYTSGSTGMPKGVMVDHRNVANFFAGMDALVDRRDGDTWLAVTSLSFDIAVLELFYALSRGFRVVVGGDPDRMAVADRPLPATDRGMEFSLFYWGNDDGAGAEKYRLLLEGAKFADANGFCAVWTPERHFHAFGGPYPNPAVTGAAVAAVTRNVAVRAGSCVAPLHHPARIAEEWAVIDNLTDGRAGIGFASGWQPDDFVLRPENTPPANRAATFAALEQVRRLWRGEAVSFPRADGTPHRVVTQPRPVSKDLPVWVTTAGNPETWREAGRHGANVLTHLLGQSIDEVKAKIAIYRRALREAGHAPDDFTVTLMLHSFVADSREEARRVARGPMKDYLRSAAGLIKQYAWAFPAFRKPAGLTDPMQIDLNALGDDEMEAILDFAFERYFEESGLFGTVDECTARVDDLKRIGVDEIACLIDFGIAPATVLDALTPLAEVVRRANAPAEIPPDDVSLAAQIVRHRVTHLQCTPSMARMICLNQTARGALGGLRQMLLGGEALPGALVRDLRDATGARILNMYGPTETTIWSTAAEAADDEDTCNIGRPIANTRVYVLDDRGAPAPVGVAGELCIGGAGVTRGYWRRPELTADRFVPDPFAAGEPRMYRTGDLARWRADGSLEFLGRTDHQVKLRGYRIELGEIEARLAELPGVTGAVVVAREDRHNEPRLVAYVTGTAPRDADWRAHLKRHLPVYMLPAHLVALEAFPLTPNAKIDRAALPAPAERVAEVVRRQTFADGSSVAKIAAVFQRLLGVPEIRAEDNFFALGGHSLLAVQAHRELMAEFPGRLGVTDLFRYPTAGGLAAHLDGAAAAPGRPPAPAPDRQDAIAARRALRQRRIREAG